MAALSGRWNRIKETLRLRPALRLVWESSPRLALACGVLAIVQGLLPLLALLVTKRIVDAVARVLAHPAARSDFRPVVYWSGAAVLVAVALSVCRSLVRLAQEHQQQVVGDRVQALLHRKSTEVDLGCFEDPDYYDLLHRASRDAPFRPTRIVNGLSQLLQNGIFLGGVVVLLASFHWATAVILLLSGVPIVLLRMGCADEMYKWNRARVPVERRLSYFHWILTSDTYAKEVRLFGTSGFFIGLHNALRQRLRSEFLALLAKRSVAELMVQAIGVVAVFGCFVYVALRAANSALTVGDMVMYLQAVQRGQGSMQDVLTSISGLYEDNLFLTSLGELLRLRPTVVAPPHPVPVPRPVRAGLVFNDVSFAYRGGRGNALEGIHLRVDPGEWIAIVGENGSGKTTAVKLLCRYYDPSSGTITLDGTDLRRFDPAALRREISGVFQDYSRYFLTAHDNIWLGDLDLPAKSARMMAVAACTGAHDTIVRLKSGYDTVLGPNFEGAAELSAGQWQRIALARAMLRDAQIFVLDEPTSHLDAAAELRVFTALREMFAGRMGIVVSHRISTAREADRIYVMEAGRIVETGSHGELMRRGDRYSRLFETQARSYQ